MTNYALPNFVKRNARYRGPRESEKYLLSHQEQIFDIRYGWKMIDALTQKEADLIHQWFEAKNEPTPKNYLISLEKTFVPILQDAQYPLINHVETGVYSNVVVKLDDNEIPMNKYRIENNHLILNAKTATSNPNPQKLTISCLAQITINETPIIGTTPIIQRLSQLNERLAEIERRIQYDENAGE